METVAAAGYARGAATRSPACCAAMSFSQSYRPKAARPATSFYGESLRANTARTSFPAGRQSKAASRAALTTRCAIGDSLEEFLTKATPDKNLIRLLICMGEAMRTIAFKVRTASCGGTACVNSFGDEQLAVDMLADKLLFEALEYSHVCKYACSEEVPELQDMGGPVEGGFSVAFDPLDGSSIVDTNFTVGTIFGVWPGDKLTGVTGGDQVAAAMGIYGPRTTFVVALKDCPGTHEFLLLDEGKWQHVKDTTSIGEGKMFSPGNLRATFDNPDYDKLVNYYVKEKYTLRYTGGMVPDVNQEMSDDEYWECAYCGDYRGMCDRSHLQDDRFFSMKLDETFKVCMFLPCHARRYVLERLGFEDHERMETRSANLRTIHGGYGINL